MAWIWFSCFCWASENFRVMPAAAAASLMDLVFAGRQPDSEPTCEKPRVIVLLPPPPPPPEASFLPQAARAPEAVTTTAPARKFLRLSIMPSKFGQLRYRVISV